MKVGAGRVRNNGTPEGCAPGVPAWLPRTASRERSADVPPTVRGPAPAPLDCGRGSADTLLTSPTSKKISEHSHERAHANAMGYAEYASGHDSQPM